MFLKKYGVMILLFTSSASCMHIHHEETENISIVPFTLASYESCFGLTDKNLKKLSAIIHKSPDIIMFDTKGDNFNSTILFQQHDYTTRGIILTHTAVSLGFAYKAQQWDITEAQEIPGTNIDTKTYGYYMYGTYGKKKEAFILGNFFYDKEHLKECLHLQQNFFELHFHHPKATSLVHVTTKGFSKEDQKIIVGYITSQGYQPFKFHPSLEPVYIKPGLK